MNVQDTFLSKQALKNALVRECAEKGFGYVTAKSDKSIFTAVLDKWLQRKFATPNCKAWEDWKFSSPEDVARPSNARKRKHTVQPGWPKNKFELTVM